MKDRVLVAFTCRRGPTRNEFRSATSATDGCVKGTSSKPIGKIYKFRLYFFYTNLLSYRPGNIKRTFEYIRHVLIKVDNKMNLVIENKTRSYNNFKRLITKWKTKLKLNGKQIRRGCYISN